MNGPRALDDSPGMELLPLLMPVGQEDCSRDPCSISAHSFPVLLALIPSKMLLSFRFNAPAVTVTYAFAIDLRLPDDCKARDDDSNLVQLP